MDSEMNNQLPDYVIWPQFEDGTPVNIGDEVINYYGSKFKVQRIIYDGHKWKLTDAKCYSTEEVKANRIPFKRPFTDSWEKLKEDSIKSAYEYWNCSYISCENCPNMIENKTPMERYGCGSCSRAMISDIVERAKNIAKHEME